MIQNKVRGSAKTKGISATLNVAWIRKHIIGQYLDKAIDQPTKENVSNYLYLDRLVKEKAERVRPCWKTGD